MQGLGRGVLEFRLQGSPVRAPEGSIRSLAGFGQVSVLAVGFGFGVGFRSLGPGFMLPLGPGFMLVYLVWLEGAG